MYLDGTSECARIATPQMKLPQFKPTNAAVGLARKLQRGSVMENKIQTLRRCIARVTLIHKGWIHMMPDDARAKSRFVALWQARNRRTRVLLSRQAAR